jgi:DNA-binding NarL/FixJ family response regulator
LKAGAAGYMLKDEDPSIIATAVRAVARGETWMSAAVTAAVVNHTVREPVRSAEATLSVREREVLQELSSGKENQEIGATLHITERTVRFHLRNIYDKLGVRRGEAIARGVRMGLGERSEMETAFTE